MLPELRMCNHAAHETSASEQHQTTSRRLSTLEPPWSPAGPGDPLRANGSLGAAIQILHRPPLPRFTYPVAPPSGHPVVRPVMNPIILPIVPGMHPVMHPAAHPVVHPVIQPVAFPYSHQQATPWQAYQPYPALQGVAHPAAGVIMGNQPERAADTQAEAPRLNKHTVQTLQHQTQTAADTQAEAPHPNDHAAQTPQHQAAQPSYHNPHVLMPSTTPPPTSPPPTSPPPTNIPPARAGQGAQGQSFVKKRRVRSRLPLPRVVIPFPAPTTSARGSLHGINRVRQPIRNPRNTQAAGLVTVRVAS